MGDNSGVVRQPCCKDWEIANKLGSDCNGFESLIHWFTSEDNSSLEPTMGCKTSSVKFCPWCGNPKTEEPIGISNNFQ